MCTIGTIVIDGKRFLFKSRDKKENPNSRIVREEGILLVTDDKAHYEGINRYGVGIVEATLDSSLGYVDPSEHLRIALNEQTAERVVEVLARSRCVGNFIVSDGRRTYGIEKTLDEFEYYPIDGFTVLTNHAVQNKSPHNIMDRSSVARYNRAVELIRKVKILPDIVSLLSDGNGKSADEVYNQFTVCSLIYDLAERKILFYSGKPIVIDPEVHTL